MINSHANRKNEFRKAIANVKAASENSSDIVLSGNMKADLQKVIARLFDEQTKKYSDSVRREKLQEEWSLRFVSAQMMLESGVPLSEHTFNGIKELQKLAQTKLNQFDVE